MYIKFETFNQRGQRNTAFQPDVKLVFKCRNNISNNVSDFYMWEKVTGNSPTQIKQCFKLEGCPALSMVAGGKCLYGLTVGKVAWGPE